MREYGAIQTQFWSDVTLQNLSTHSKLLAVYLLSSPHTNMLGCFRLPIAYVAEDLKWEQETVSKAFAELAHVKFLIRDAQSSWILIPHFLIWNPIENPNQGKSLSKLFNRVPSQSCVFKPLIEQLLTQTKYLDKGFQNRLETLVEPFLNQEQNQDQNQDQDQDQKQKHFQEQDDDGATEVAPSSSTLKIPLNKQGFLIQDPLSIDIAIPLKNNNHFLVTPSQLENWKKTYRNIDVLQELRQIQAWNESNPTERKTESNILRHINTWLAKEQRESLHLKQSPPINHANRLAERGLSPTLEHNLIVGEQWLNRSVTTEK